MTAAQVLTSHFYKALHESSYSQMVFATTWEYPNVSLILFLFCAIVQSVFNHQHQEQVGGEEGGGNRGSLPRAPSTRGPPNSAELVQILAVSDQKVRRTGIVVDCAV